LETESAVFRSGDSSQKERLISEREEALIEWRTIKKQFNDEKKSNQTTVNKLEETIQNIRNSVEQVESERNGFAIQIAKFEVVLFFEIVCVWSKLRCSWLIVRISSSN
jgi:chromosome segregation ATPase